VSRKYNAQYFIDKFENIAPELWCQGKFELDGRSCALGHCGVRSGWREEWGAEARALRSLFSGAASVALVNDRVPGLPRSSILRVLYRKRKEGL
jgi:hypothetical protein